MRIFVTGGAGFIGKHLVSSLLEKKFDVIVFDKQLIDSKLVKFGNHENLSSIIGDITNFQGVLDAIDNIDVMIHLAAKISVEESIKNPAETFRVNEQGTINLLKACSEKGISKFIAISSAAVYGDSNGVLDEKSPIKPISPYGESKLSMEKHIKKKSKEHGINSIILRLFNVYGKGQSSEYAGVISKFIQNVSNNKPPIIFGDGKQTRDFVSVEDVVQAILNSIVHIDHKFGRVYNIGTGISLEIFDIAKKIIEESGKKFEIQFENSKKGDILNSKTSIALAKKEISYNPKISFERGIKDLMK